MTPTNEPNNAESSPYMTPGEVAERFRVSPKTVTRWATEGKLSSTLTPGGQRRFLRAEVDALMPPVPATTVPEVEP